MPGSVNDSRMLRRSLLFHQGQCNSLWDGNHSFHGFSPYLLGDGGYPILPWLMVPHRRQGHQSMADSLFNCKLCKHRAVVENAFALLKQSFRELHSKTDLHVTFVPDVVTCCAILHNLLLRQSEEDVERLLEVLRCEGDTRGDSQHAAEVAAVLHLDSVGEVVLAEVPEASQKRRDLGIFLSMQRVVPM